MINRATSQVVKSQGAPFLDDSIASNIPSTAMRPHINGESRNCKLCTQSTANYMQFAPILTLQYISLFVAAILLTCLLSILVFGSLPQLPYRSAIASLDPTLKAFVYFFGGSALIYVTFLLLKPVRAIKFNKNAGVFWIEKQRVFGWKVGESAQMPLVQICALQILSYANPDGTSYKHLTPAKEHEVNVVFCNGARVNIFNHRNGVAIRRDASALSEFLDVAVWDTECNTVETYLHAPATTVK